MLVLAGIFAALGVALFLSALSDDSPKTVAPEVVTDAAPSLEILTRSGKPRGTSARRDALALAAREDGAAAPTPFSGGTWVGADGPLARIEDYSFDEDELIVVYDEAVTPSPVVSVVPTEDGLDAVVSLNGRGVMTVAGAAGRLSAEHITLMEESFSPAGDRGPA